MVNRVANQAHSPPLSHKPSHRPDCTYTRRKTPDRYLSVHSSYLDGSDRTHSTTSGPTPPVVS
ncbi:hypothetical protein E2C01_051249 [Portunus trituberculatus]|uniref:Uncharacterized protein n=1 Tax=Portunus trituberculatus TaxID=210409 RepID=A0A5B7GB24_PORTR|nr:hypothetical protein [Portunus trituberculatus]